MTERSDRELLIEVKTKMELWHDEIKTVITNHIREDDVKNSTMTQAITAAHRRLDTFGSLKDKVLGGTAVVGFLFGIVALIIKIYKG